MRVLSRPERIPSRAGDQLKCWNPVCGCEFVLTEEDFIRTGSLLSRLNSDDKPRDEWLFRCPECRVIVRFGIMAESE